MLVSAYKSRIQSKFEGGKSLTVDWYENAKEAGEALRGQISPASLKRIAPIYGGLNGETGVYYCPADVDIPSALYNPRVARERWEYQPPQAFHLNEEDYKFTIEEQNGVKFLLVRHALVSGTLTVDKFDVVGSKTGVTLATNDYNYLTGTGSLEGTFTDSLVEVSETLSSVIDITDYKRGVALCPINFEDKEKVASVELILKTDASNYYTMISTLDSVGDYFKNGWNMVRFDIAKAVETGTVTDTSIASYTLNITMNSGESQTVIIDKISIEKGMMYNFEYYSSYLFKDATTNAWKETATVDADVINLGEKEASIIVYEGCRLIGFGGKKKKGMANFDEELMRKYDAYWETNPSSALPMQYSGSPNIGKTLNI
jgi:hypothetical protein